MALNPDDVLKILLAVAAGGLIGLEREYRDKAAGFRTLIFICVGACLFTILSYKFAPSSDPNRIAANIVTGVGFLGAGVILRAGGRVIGLTTAAAIWLTAAVGMAIGGGEYLTAGVVVLTAMFVLWLFPALEQRIDNIREERLYEITFAGDLDQLAALERTVPETGLHIQYHSHTRSGDELTCSWNITGSPESHEKLVRRLIEHPEIKGFRY